MPFGTSGPVKGPRVLVQRFWCNLGANMISRNFVDTFCSARYVPSSRWSLPQLCFIQALNSSHPRDRRGQPSPYFQPHTRGHFPPKHLTLNPTQPQPIGHRPAPLNQPRSVYISPKLPRRGPTIIKNLVLYNNAWHRILFLFQFLRSKLDLHWCSW